MASVPNRANHPKRKGIYDWEIHGKYDGGWERVHTDESRAGAAENLQKYRENEPNTLFKLKAIRKGK